MKHPEPWPLRHLVLRTPRLELRPDDDAGLLELVDEAYHGVHPPDQMPFGVPWTDAPAEHLGREMLQYYWSERVTVRPERWTINFLVRLDGRVVGTQRMRAGDFGILREVGTGSWVGMRHQGRGIGTEMRAAALAFAFDHLGAVRARSSAYVRNRASLRVSERLGYRHDGTSSVVRRGHPTEEIRLLVTPETFVCPDWKLEVEGVDACRPLLAAQ